MQDKEEGIDYASPFNLLANELIHKISQNLEDDREAHDCFAFTCRKFYQLTKSERLRVRLVEYVTEGNQAKAKEMLEKYPELLLKRGFITDKSGRVFENITVWVYMLWALDVKYMGPMMLNCLPQNEQGKEISIELLNQFERLEKNGVRYVLNGVPYDEKHYNFYIITALKNFVTHFAQWDWQAKVDYWKQIIGEAQFYLPAHVAQHYCDPDVPFYPLPEFNSELFNRTLAFFNNLTRQVENWWPNELEEVKLGVHFAITRSGAKEGSNGINHMRGADFAATKDMQALTALYHIRINTDLPALKQKLLDRIHTLNVEPECSCSMAG